MFREEEMVENVRENFVGIVVDAQFPCGCEICRKGTERLVEMGREPRTANRIHIVIKPLEKYENFQHAWYNESKLIWSGMGAFVVSLNRNLNFVPKGSTEEQWKQVQQFLIGNVFEWQSVKPVEFVSKVKNIEIPRNLPEGLKNQRETWIPIRIVNPKELQFFGITKSLKELYEEAKKEYESGVTEVKIEEIDITKEGGSLLEL